MAIVKKIEDLKKVLTVQGDFDFDQIAPFVPEAEQEYIVDILGVDLYNDINTKSNHPTVIKALVEQISLPVCTLSTFEAIPFLNVGFSANGLVVSKGDHHAPASQTRTEDLKRLMLDLGHKRLDYLLRYIEQNKTAIDAVTDYAVLDQTAIYGNQSFILKNALAFNEWVDINKSRWLFVKMLPTLRNVQGVVLPELIGNAFYAYLKTTAASVVGLSVKELLLLPMLQEYLANQVFADSLISLSMNVDDRGITIFNNNYSQTVNVALAAPPERIKELRNDKLQIANNAMNRLLAFLNKNAVDYPIFMASDWYVDPNAVSDANGDVVSGEGYSGFL